MHPHTRPAHAIIVSCRLTLLGHLHRSRSRPNHRRHLRSHARRRRSNLDHRRSRRVLHRRRRSRHTPLQPCNGPRLYLPNPSSPLLPCSPTRPIISFLPALMSFASRLPLHPSFLPVLSSFLCPPVLLPYHSAPHFSR